MNLRLAAAQTVLTNRIKVDDTLLRRRQMDIMPKLIAMVEEEKEKMRLREETAKVLPAAS
jgi:hypothetical protein